MKGPSVHFKNMPIKQLCNRKVRDFAMALLARKVSGAFEKRGPDPGIEPGTLCWEASALATAPSLLPISISSVKVRAHFGNVFVKPSPVFVLLTV